MLQLALTLYGHVFRYIAESSTYVGNWICGEVQSQTTVYRFMQITTIVRFTILVPVRVVILTFGLFWLGFGAALLSHLKCELPYSINLTSINLQ